MTGLAFDKEEKIVGKGENAAIIFFFSHNVSTASYIKVVESRGCMEELNQFV